MRWKTLCGGVSLFVSVSGCQQRCFVTESDFNATTTSIVHLLDNKVDLACKPITEEVGPPPTLYDLERKIRFLSLAEVVSTYSFTAEELEEASRNGLSPNPKTSPTPADDALFDESVAEIYHRQMEIRKADSAAAARR